MKILVVDDSQFIRKIIASCASVLGRECVGVPDGEQALNVLREDPDGFALVCLDWNMPNMNGFDCLVAIRLDPRWRELPVIMITTEGSKDAILEALKAGATSYLTKPFSEQDLLSKIMDCLGMGFD